MPRPLPTLLHACCKLLTHVVLPKFYIVNLKFLYLLGSTFLNSCGRESLILLFVSVKIWYGVYIDTKIETYLRSWVSDMLFERILLVEKTDCIQCWIDKDATQIWIKSRVCSKLELYLSEDILFDVDSFNLYYCIISYTLTITGEGNIWSEKVYFVSHNFQILQY